MKKLNRKLREDNIRAISERRATPGGGGGGEPYNQYTIIFFIRRFFKVKNPPILQSD